MRRLVFLAAVAPVPAMADPDGFGHMMGGGYGSGVGMIFGPVIWIIVLGLIVAGVIWFVRRLDGHPSHPRPSDAMAELDLRFARGEIDAEDYAARKKLLAP